MARWRPGLRDRHLDVPKKISERKLLLGRTVRAIDGHHRVSRTCIDEWLASWVRPGGELCKRVPVSWMRCHANRVGCASMPSSTIRSPAQSCLTAPRPSVARLLRRAAARWSQSSARQLPIPVRLLSRQAGSRAASCGPRKSGLGPCLQRAPTLGIRSRLGSAVLRGRRG